MPHPAANDCLADERHPGPIDEVFVPGGVEDDGVAAAAGREAPDVIAA